MARFRFGLEGLLEQRRRAERDRQVEVARIEAERVGLEDRLRRIQASLSSGKDAVRGALGGAVDVPTLRAHSSATLFSEMEAQRVVLELGTVLKRLETARSALGEAAKERRAVELLKERRHEAWLAEEARKERVELDELATARAARRLRPMARARGVRRTSDEEAWS